MGDWQPVAEFCERCSRKTPRDADISRPYPFCLAYAAGRRVSALGDRREWQVEWKWDGIRAQLIRRGGRACSVVARRGAHHRPFPRARRACASLPDGTVLDGEMLAWTRRRAAARSPQLQRRIGAQELGTKILAEVPGRA